MASLLRWRPGTALALLGAALLAPVHAQTPACLAYEPAEVSLQGRLEMAVFPGPPHYRSFDTGDAPESVWLLHLAAPVCIAALADDLNNTAQGRVETVQIVPRAPFSMALNGGTVRVTGTLYRPHGGHPHAGVLLRATVVQAVRTAP